MHLPILIRSAVTLAVISAAPPVVSQPSVFRSFHDGLHSITARDLLRHVEVLSSDDFQGRAPGTVGEAMTVDYLMAQFRRFGLESGNPDGSYIQKVPMVGIRSETAAELKFGQKTERLSFPRDYVAWTVRPEREIRVDESPLVFVGYGVEAPEYRWDDYKGANLAGRTLVMLVNDPQVPHPGSDSRLDPRVFKGKEMTYYGRWTYKLEEAARKGAEAVILVHETGPAGYPYSVVITSWGGENFTLEAADNHRGEVRVAAWMSLDRAERMFQAAGFDFRELKEQALRRDFRPIPLRAKVSFQLKNQVRRIESRNVLGMIEGSHPIRKKEWVVVSAHWDHLGRDKNLKGDQIYNGALDNATGVAGLLELAQMFAGLRRQPARSLLFLATTGEEQGLLGAKYYAENPFHPLKTTIANLNMDGLNPWGLTRDVVMLGRGQSTLDTLVEQSARTQKRQVKPDPEPEKGSFFRSDQFEFVKRGVPAIYLSAGTHFVGRPSNYGKERRRQYTQNDYHQVSDEIKDDWNMAGAVMDLRLLARIIYRLANESRNYPRWNLNSPFRKIRHETAPEIQP